MDKILLLLLGLLVIFVAFLVFAYNQKNKLSEKRVKENFEDPNGGGEEEEKAEYFEGDVVEEEPEHFEGDGVEEETTEHFEGDGVEEEPEHFEGDGVEEDPEHFEEHGVEEDPEHFEGDGGEEELEQFEEHGGEDEVVEAFEGCNKKYHESFTTDSGNDVDCETQEHCGKGFTCTNSKCVPDQEHFQNKLVHEYFESEYYNQNKSVSVPEQRTEYFDSYNVEPFYNGGTYNEFNSEFNSESQQHDEHFFNYNGNTVEHMGNKEATLKLFYADWCGHCKRFKPTFDNELPQAIKQRGIPCKLESINADNRKDLVKEYNVKGFPTVILVTSDGRKNEYSGNRNARDIVEFLSKNI